MDRINFPDTPGQRFTKTEIKYLQDSILSEFLARSVRISSPGIVSANNPRELNSPLHVEQEGNQLRIYPGSVLFDSGQLLVVEQELTIEVPSDDREYLLVLQASDEFFNAQITQFEDSIQTLVKVNPLLTFITLNLYAAYSSNAEFLAYYSRASGVRLSHPSIDVRRWSSPADWLHRGQRGAGAVTDSNPHGTTVFDMSLSSNIGFWHAFDRDCLLVTPKAGEPGGQLIRETINTSQWLAAGTGRWRCTLRHEAMALGAVTRIANNSPTAVLPGILASELENISNSRQLYVYGSKPSDRVEVSYYVAATLNFRITSNNPYELTSLVSDAQDILVHNGQRVPLQNIYSFDLADRSNFPCTYWLASSDKAGVHLQPQIVSKAVDLSDLNVGNLQLDRQLDTPSHVRVLLAGTSISASLDVKLEVNGLDDSGAQIKEELRFTGSWRQQLGRNFQQTSRRFAQLSDIRLISANSDITSVIQVQAVLDHGDLSELFLLARADLHPEGFENLVDLRVVELGPLGTGYVPKTERTVHALEFPIPHQYDPYNGQLYSGLSPFLLSDGSPRPVQGSKRHRYLRGEFISRPLLLDVPAGITGTSFRLNYWLDGPMSDAEVRVYKLSGNSLSAVTRSANGTLSGVAAKDAIVIHAIADRAPLRAISIDIN